MTEVCTPDLMLAKVQLCFCLNITQAAAIFRVTRQTIYRWLLLGDFSSLHRKQQRRMLSLYRLASDWPPVDKLPMIGLTLPIDGEDTLLELLSAPELDIPKIIKRKEALLEQSDYLKKLQGEKTTLLVERLGAAFVDIGRKRQ